MPDTVIRPVLHFTPHRHWMNDPNGCVYQRGVYHLFFQYHPYSCVWGPMHWGHATSTDLLHWHEEPVALSPDEQGMAFSGSVVPDPENRSGLFSHTDGLAAFHTRHLDAPEWPHPRQQQCLAISDDHGATWTPYRHNPVVPNPGLKDFRDPKVFYHHATHHWVMLVVAGQSVRFYRSANLTDWSPCGEFHKDQGHDTVVWECPDLLQLADESGACHWVLIVSGVTTPEAPFPPMQYFVGHFDGQTFAESAPSANINRVDYGLDFYAAQSFNGQHQPTQQPVWIAWANHWFYANDIPAQGWRGTMTLPRLLSLCTGPDGLRLRQQLPEAIEHEIPGQMKIVDSQTPALPASNTLQVLRFVIPPDVPSLHMRLSNERNERITFRWDAATRIFAFERHELMQSDVHPAMQTVQEADLSGFASLPSSLPVTVLIDGSIVEIFLLDGLAVITSLIFPKATLQDLRVEPAGITGLIGLSYHFG